MPPLPLWLTRVRMDSMAPRLRDGQLVWTIRARPRQRIRRGAVVAVDSHELRRRIVKRIVGLPGEHVRFEGSDVWVDGRLLAEPYAIKGSHWATFDVPEGHYLLLGDNRPVSNDSRAWRRPYVARGEVVGVLIQRRSRRGSPAFSRTASAGPSLRPLVTATALSSSVEETDAGTLRARFEFPPLTSCSRSGTSCGPPVSTPP